VSAVVGAVVTVVFSFVPLSPALGGGVAAYLRNGDRREGARVGAIAGGIAAVPILVVLTLVFGGLSLFTVAVGVGAPVNRGLAAGSLFGTILFLGILLLSTLFVLAFVVGLSAAGGWVAVVLLEESDRTPGTGRPVRDSDTPEGRSDLSDTAAATGGPVGSDDASRDSTDDGATGPGDDPSLRDDRLGDDPSLRDDDAGLGGEGPSLRDEDPDLGETDPSSRDDDSSRRDDESEDRSR
jgi:hypothetical protein